MKKIPGRIRRDILANNFRHFSPGLLATIGKNSMRTGTWDWESFSPHGHQEAETRIVKSFLNTNLYLITTLL